MPHTSHRRQKQNTKRVKVETDDGWTHIARDRSRPHTFRQEPHTYAPEPAPPALTLGELQISYEKAKKAWNNCETSRLLRALISQAIESPDDSGVRRCACLGLGSLSSINLEWRRVSMWQLVAFLDMVEHLRSNWTPMQVVMQDPVFNEVDTSFLRELGVEVVEDPCALELLDNATFLFCPHLSVRASLTCLRRGPVRLLIDHDFQHIRQGFSEWALSATEQELKVLDDFTQAHDSASLPQVDERFTGFNNLRLYWKRRESLG